MMHWDYGVQVFWRPGHYAESVKWKMIRFVQCNLINWGCSGACRLLTTLVAYAHARRCSRKVRFGDSGDFLCAMAEFAG